jgi:hypothetical protein
MTTYSEQVLDDTVEGKKVLGLTGRFETAHLPLQHKALIFVD